jgi:hypothetical protein
MILHIVENPNFWKNQRNWNETRLYINLKPGEPGKLGNQETRETRETRENKGNISIFPWSNY